jgi:hypothetical protein
MRIRNFARPEVEVPAKIQIKHHEGAIVCSLEHSISGDPDKLKELVYSTISEIAEWTIQHGGLVGHIKASLQTSCGNLIYSCTGDEIHIHEVPGQGSYLDFTAIVFFVEEKQLEKHLAPLLKILC